ncbi:MAG: HD domain-containing protein [Thermoanaerobacterales bacterium]|nr:HD domain-containing protein [Thermoanaerobacterales bacterium]
MHQAPAPKEPYRTPTMPTMNTLVAARAAVTLARPGDGLLRHSQRVADLVARVLEREPSLAGDLGREIVVLAAFVHDLGKAEWPAVYFATPLHQLSQRARQAIHSHPLAGANLAASLGVTPDVRALIEQHHERAGGGGYPRGLADPHPAALLIGACDAYCACLEPRPYRPEPLPEFEVLREAAKVGIPEVVRVLDDLSRTG